MKYDDASWHYGGDFPADLPASAGATHIAMFVIWCWLNGLAGEEVLEDANGLGLAQTRADMPGNIFVKISDEKFVDADLTEKGNLFAEAYYGERGYYSDYEVAARGQLPSLYHVPDNWETYEKIAPVISKRYIAWENKQTSWLEKLWSSIKR